MREDDLIGISYLEVFMAGLRISKTADTYHLVSI